MKRKRVWRYYCEYCKKSGCSGGWMKKHEASCTANPNRNCKMCEVIGEAQQPISELIEALGDGRADGLERLREISFDCPMCILAAIRQSGIQRPFCGSADPGFKVDYNFRKEIEARWEQINQDGRDRYNG